MVIFTYQAETLSITARARSNRSQASRHDVVVQCALTSRTLGRTETGIGHWNWYRHLGHPNGRAISGLHGLGVSEFEAFHY